MKKDQRKLGCPSLSHQLHLHLEGKGETKIQIIKWENKKKVILVTPLSQKDIFGGLWASAKSHSAIMWFCD